MGNNRKTRDKKVKKARQRGNFNYCKNKAWWTGIIKKYGQFGVLQVKLERMTNWQRTKWNRAGSPEHRVDEFLAMVK